MNARSRYTFPPAGAGRPHETTADIFLAVSNSGSDSYSAARDFVSGGDYSATPYATIQAAIDALPKVIRHRVVINIAAGNFEGALIQGFSGGGWDGNGERFGIHLVGTGTAASGIGTQTGRNDSSDSLTELWNANADWTEDALIGKFVRISAFSGTSQLGEGYDPAHRPTRRVIKDNTDYIITFAGVPAALTSPGYLSGFSVFNVEEAGTYVYQKSSLPVEGLKIAFDIADNTCPIFLDHFAIYNPFGNTLHHGVRSRSNGLVSVTASRILDASYEAVLSISDAEFNLDNCEVRNDIVIQKSGRTVRVADCVGYSGGHIKLENFPAAEVTGIEFTGASTNVLRAINGLQLFAEIKATGGSATPVYLESIQKFEAVGANKLTGGSNTGGSTYGVEIVSDGRYTLTGSDITGAGGDVRFLGETIPWATLATSTYGIAEGNAASAVAYTSIGKSLKYGNYLFNGSVDVSGRLLKYGYDNPSCNLGSVTLTGSDTYDMEAQGVREHLEVACNSTSARVTLPSGCAIAGARVQIDNKGSETLTCQAPSGGSIVGSATVAAGTCALFWSRNGSGGKEFVRAF